MTTLAVFNMIRGILTALAMVLETDCNIGSPKPPLQSFESGDVYLFKLFGRGS
jgi:hypothetical protein